jgi:OmpA-OmpF porin, OOP family
MFKFGNATGRMLTSKITLEQKRIMLKKSACGLTLFISASAVFMQAGATDIQANPKYSAYLQDGRGVIVRSANGLCWRSGYWTPADAVAGCDGELVPPIAKPTAPDIVPPVAAAPVTPPAPPLPCDFSVTLNSDQTFAFNSGVLGNAAKKRIDRDVLAKLASCEKTDLITITGHADRLGSQTYNQKLSEKRANAVAAYLKSKGVTAPINIVGLGETQAIKNCENMSPRKKLIECLAPNRRVVVEAQGVAKR